MFHIEVCLQILKSTSAYVKKVFSLFSLKSAIRHKELTFTCTTFTLSSWSTLSDTTMSRGLIQKRHQLHWMYSTFSLLSHQFFVYYIKKKTGVIINSTMSPQMDEYVKLLSKFSCMKKSIQFNSKIPTKIFPIATDIHIHECTFNQTVSPLTYGSWNYIRKHIWETHKGSERLVNL